MFKATINSFLVFLVLLIHSCFINHSDDPNCMKWCEDDKYFIKTLKPIHKGEELFLKYTFYTI